MFSEILTEKKLPDSAAADRAYLQILSRPPQPAERTIVGEYLKSAPARDAACRDLVWSLLAGAEFRFNH